MTHLLRAYERGCLRVTLNRPAKRNALSREMLRELKAVFDAHASLDDLRLAVLGGAGESARCSDAMNGALNGNQVRIFERTLSGCCIIGASESIGIMIRTMIGNMRLCVSWIELHMAPIAA